MLDIKSGVFAVKFGAKWCGPCKTVDKQLEKMQEEFETITFIYIDVDDSPEISKNYKIKSLPTVILFKDGIEVDRIIGAVKLEPMRKAFRDFLHAA